MSIPEDVKQEIEYWCINLRNDINHEFLTHESLVKAAEFGYSLHSTPKGMKEDDGFLLYLSEARDRFVKKVNDQEWNTQLRMEAENILIAYDQVRERYKQYESDTHTADVKMKDVGELPIPVIKKILLARNALIENDVNEAFHQLYAIANPEFNSYEPWAKFEDLVKDSLQSPDSLHKQSIGEEGEEKK